MDILSSSSANKKKIRGGKYKKILSIIYSEEIQVGSWMGATNFKLFPPREQQNLKATCL